jgi:hypothetical protein
MPNHTICTCRWQEGLVRLARRALEEKADLIMGKAEPVVAVAKGAVVMYDLGVSNYRGVGLTIDPLAAPPKNGHTAMTADHARTTSPLTTQTAYGIYHIQETSLDCGKSTTTPAGRMAVQSHDQEKADHLPKKYSKLTPKRRLATSPCH